LALAALLLLVVAGLLFWLWMDADAEAPVPGAGGNAGGTSAAAEPAEVPIAVGQAGDDAARSAAATQADSRSAGADPTAPGIIGQVVDELGVPVAKAVVRLGPSQGSGFRDFDWTQWEELDPAAISQRVQASLAERVEVVTDERGRFRVVPATVERSLSLRVLAQKHQLLDRNVPRPADEDVDVGVLTLRRGAAVRGQVVDRAGSPVAGARVVRLAASRNRQGGGFPGFGGGMGGVMDFGDWDMSMPGMEWMDLAIGEQQAVSDAQGRFQLPYIEPGDFVLRAQHAEHPMARLEGLRVEPGAELSGLLVVVEPGAVIQGRIVGVPDGTKSLRVMASMRREAAPGDAEGPAGMMSMVFGEAERMATEAGFAFGERQVDTDDEFQFTLRGLQVGKSYRVWAAPSGRGIAGNAICTDRLEVSAGTRGLELRYEAGVSVRVRVVAKGTEQGIETLWVRDQLRGGGGMADIMAMIPRATRSKRYPDGQVTLANLRPRGQQTLALTIEAVGYERFEQRDIELPASNLLDLGTVELVPAPVVQVEVRGADGRPAVGAQVQLSEAGGGGGRRGGNPFAAFAGGRVEVEAFAGGRGPGGMANMMPFFPGGASGPRSGKTDALGRISLNAWSGEMEVAVTSADWAPYRSAPFAAAPQGVTAHAVNLLRGGRVQVLVLDSERKPLAQTRVEHTAPDGERSSETTDAAGLVTFVRQTPGTHQFRLGSSSGPMAGMPRMPFGGGRLGGADEAPWTAVEVADGKLHTIELQKAASATLRGFVRENGLPLAEARLQWLEGVADAAAQGGMPAGLERFAELAGGQGGRTRSGRSEADGRYELRELPAGEHRLRISANGRALPTVVTVSLRLGDNTLDINLDSVVVRGRVVDSQGQPIASASIAIEQAAAASADEATQAIDAALSALGGPAVAGGGRATRTDAEGNFEVRGLDPGSRLRLRASARGLASAVTPVLEAPLQGVLDGVLLTLGAAGKLRVEMAGGGMFAGVRAQKLAADGSVDSSVPAVNQVLRGGRATLDGLSPGRWQVVVRGMDGAVRPPSVVEITAGATANLQF
jgi:protocatechuate 3,4-dioxygenase beta subunit